MRDAWSEAFQVLGRALRFFARHYPVVFAFGAVASLQRFLAVGGDERFAFADTIGGEVVTMASRVLLVLWVVRKLFADEGVPWSQVGKRLERFVEGRVGMLLVSGGMLVLLTGISQGVPALVEMTLADAGPIVEAWVLATKNVTVIPLVIVWLTVLARHAMTVGAAAEEVPDRETGAQA